MRKKRVLISLVIAYTLFIGIIIFSIVLGLYKSELFETPPKPEITYGEFPFKLEYELNGKKYTVEDVWVCEFNGFGSNEGFGKHRQWKGKVKSTGEDKIVLLEVDEPIELDWQGIPMTQTIYYLPGPARYYMGDMIGVAGTFSHYFPEAFCFEYFFPFSTSDSRLSAEELYKKFGIKLINWEYTPPIKNTFK